MILTMSAAIVQRITKLLRGFSHSEEEVAAHTCFQKDRLFPVLRDQLTGGERTILDFGCGPGRFTPDLAQMIDGKAVMAGRRHG